MPLTVETFEIRCHFSILIFETNPATTHPSPGVRICDTHNSTSNAATMMPRLTRDNIWRCSRSTRLPVQTAYSPATHFQDLSHQNASLRNDLSHLAFRTCGRAYQLKEELRLDETKQPCRSCISLLSLRVLLIAPIVCLAHTHKQPRVVIRSAAHEARAAEAAAKRAGGGKNFQPEQTLPGKHRFFTCFY